MSTRPWMPFYPADYISDTTDLTLREHGAYVLLILHYWKRGGLPDGEANASDLLPRCYRVCSASGPEDETAVRSVLTRFFTFANGRFHHKRVDQELEKANKISIVRAENGAKGGRTQRSKCLSKLEAKSEQTGSKSEASSQPQSDSQSEPDSESDKTPPGADAPLPAPPKGDRGVLDPTIAPHEALAPHASATPEMAEPTSPSKTEPRAVSARTSPYSAQFENFWQAYPRKVGKGAAWKKWKTQKCELLNGQIAAALRWQIESNDWRKDGGQFVPHPETYLNQRRWEDSPGVAVGPEDYVPKDPLSKAFAVMADRMAARMKVIQ